MKLSQLQYGTLFQFVGKDKVYLFQHVNRFYIAYSDQKRMYKTTKDKNVVVVRYPRY